MASLYNKGNRWGMVMKILNFKFDNSFFELHATFNTDLGLLTDYDIQMDMLIVSKAILKTAGYTNF